MPDLSEQLSAILQNPEAQKNIQNLLSSLQSGSSENSAPDFSQMFSPPPPPPKNDEPFSGMDINSLMKLQQIFSKMSCSDENINLLRALRPHLHKPEKVDEAINILRLISILPALGESGIFGGIFR